MSDQVPAQEQSAPTLTPAESALQASALQDQLATAKMTGQGAEAVSALEQQLVALLAPKAPATPEPAAVVPKEEQQPTPEPEPTPVEKSPEEIAAEAEVAAKAAEEAEEKESANHIRIKTYPEKEKDLVSMAHQMFKKGLASSFTEALDRLRGIMPTPATPEPEPVAPEPPAEITAFETEIAEIQAKMDAIADGEQVYGPEINKLTQQLIMANAKLEAARVRFESQVETQAIVSDATFEQQRTAVLKTTAKEYPQMTDKTSEQWMLARDLAKAASDPSHPDYQQSVSLDAPRFFAQKAAKLLQIKPATASPSAPQPATPTASSPAASQPAKPAPAPGSRTTAPAVAVTAQQALQAVDQMVADVLAGKGGPPKAAPPRYIMMGR